MNEQLEALKQRRADIEACTQDWMREIRLEQIDKEIAALESESPAPPAPSE
jgi:hypothetical protein